MFGFFDEPRYYMYRTRPSFFDRYMQSVERRLAHMLDTEIFDARQIAEFEKNFKELEDSVEHDEAEKKPAEGEKNEAQEHPEPKKEHPLPYQEFVFESHTTRNGKELVEEHRERVTDTDGSVHVATKRRLGNRWYVNETHTNKDGKSFSKETWHNVSEDQMEHFKREWSLKNAHALKHDSTPPAVEHQDA